MTPTAAFERGRETLLRNRDDLERARAELRWPDLGEFNWAWDWFEVFAKRSEDPYEEALTAPAKLDRVGTRATDPLLLYFNSGTTAKPKLVLHTHQSYPVGHLSTEFWLEDMD